MREIYKNRDKIQSHLSGDIRGLVAIVGPCSNQLDDLIIGEGIDLSDMRSDSLMPVHRIPPWKPRSRVAAHLQQPWEGIEQTEPKEAYERTLAETSEGVAVAVEFGELDHVYKYGTLTSLGWVGSRNVRNHVLAQSIKLGNTIGMPVGAKNCMEGKIDSAITQSLFTEDPGIPIFRGGTDYISPQQWEVGYLDAIRKTNGRMIVDVAHGSEMAHDPNRRFGKSVLGQIACLEHVIDLAKQDIKPRGVMIEASDHVYSDPFRATDPNMPFDTALRLVHDLHDTIMR